MKRRHPPILDEESDENIYISRFTDDSVPAAETSQDSDGESQEVDHSYYKKSNSDISAHLDNDTDEDDSDESWSYEKPRRPIRR